MQDTDATLSSDRQWPDPKVWSTLDMRVSTLDVPKIPTQPPPPERVEEGRTPSVT
ncbi:hypothetical protein CGRA01v4_06628 [Colletotrichum graminicola]|nr:hypothetical protein CGRA01v4_06628 [Colletotrichum graminicola]